MDEERLRIEYGLIFEEFEGGIRIVIIEVSEHYEDK